MFNPPISIWSTYFKNPSPEAAVTELRSGGFRTAELSTEHSDILLARGEPEKVGKELADYAASKDFSFLQGHLNIYNDLCTEETVDKLKRELDLFAALGIRAAVLHVNGGLEYETEECETRNAVSLRKLAEYVRGSGVTICMENLTSHPSTYSVEGLLRLIELSGCDDLGICLDTGHLHRAVGRGLSTNTQLEFIRKAGKHLKALHVNDNIGTVDDLHNMPFSSKRGLNWGEVMTGLREIDYQGIFNLEIPGERRCPPTIRRMKMEYIRKMCEFMMTEEFIAEYNAEYILEYGKSKN